MHNSTSLPAFPASHFIKEIGRGKHGARSLSRSDARDLYAAILNGQVSDLELGAILMAMRIKGESVDEIAGFLDAGEASFEQLQAPAGEFAPVVIPSYNGSRQMANLTPLLALLLAREGVPVLVHGVMHDTNRVTTAEILALLGIGSSQNVQDAQAQFAQHVPVFMPIENLAPRMAQVLSLRRVLGVRSSTHTLVKIMQPFAGPALRLTSYTHPEYLEMLSSYFVGAAEVTRGDVFLMRGTEGETVANAKRAQQILWFHGHQCTTLVERQAPVDEIPPMPEGRNAADTASWIAAALRGEQPVPPSIIEQVEHCVRVSRDVQSRLA
ncbi:DNA-binding protein YbiB [soil metagenome]